MLNIKKSFFVILSSCLIGMSLFSCQNDRDCTEVPDISRIDKDMLDKQVANIEHYLDSLGVDYISDPSGVRLEVLETGSGAVPDACSSVAVTYTGQVIGNDEFFDYNTGTVFDLSRQNLIRGMVFGLFNMRPQGEYKLYIPSPLGYGSDTLKNSSGNVIIPANSNLLFRIRINTISGN